MSASQKAVDRTGDNNPCFGRTGEQHPMFGRTGDKNPMFGKPRPAGSGRPSQQIEVLDKETNLITTYDSISAAARALDIRWVRSCDRCAKEKLFCSESTETL